MADSFYFSLSGEQVIAIVDNQKIALTNERAAQISSMDRAALAALVLDLENSFRDLTAQMDAVTGNNYYGPREPLKQEYLRLDTEQAENDRLRAEGRKLPGE